MAALRVRRAASGDLGALGRMGAALAQQHHRFDPLRFMLPDGIEQGYRSWLGQELENIQARVLIAELDGKPCGYAYGCAEPRDWNLLLDRCGGFHDLWVEQWVRREGVGSLLAESLLRELAQMALPRVVLMTSVHNTTALRLFERLGFRSTMTEMTREALPPASE